MIVDVAGWLREAAENKRILFEGAQGSSLDIDHVHIPCYSSNTTAGAACCGAGLGPMQISHYRCGQSLQHVCRTFPTEQTNEVGALLAERA